MNILMFIDTLRGGGAENVTITLAESFARRGHSVHIMIMRDISNYTGGVDGINIHPVEEGLRKIKGGIISQYSFARKLRKRYKSLEEKYGEFQLKIAHMPFPNMITKQAGIENVIAVVHSNFSQTISKLSYMKQKRKIRKFKMVYNNRKVVCVSKGVADDLISTLNLSNNPCVIYNPYNVDEIRQLACLGDEQIPAGDYIVHVGRFKEGCKRQDILVEAFDRIKNLVNVDLLFVGSGEFEEDVKKLVDKKGINDRVHFLGWKKNPYPFIELAKLLVLCSEYEGFGGVLVESLICGTVPVSTDCPSGPSEILVGELSNFLTPVNDIEQLAEKIMMALKSKITLGEKYYKQFDAEEIAKKYIELAEC